MTTFADQKYEDAVPAITDFLDFAYGMFKGLENKTRAEAEVRLYEIAEDKDEGGVLVESGGLRIAWLTCFDACKRPTLN